MTLTVWVGERCYYPDWVSFGKTTAKLVWIKRKRELEIPKDSIWEISVHDESHEPRTPVSPGHDETTEG